MLFGPRASCALKIMSGLEARGPEEHERHWSAALPAKTLQCMASAL
jgi:hypothetical protein